MNNKLIIIILLFTLLSSCVGKKKYVSSGLIKLSENQIIERAKNKEFIDFEKIIYKNNLGKIISLDSVRNLPKMSDWTSDRYSDKNGVIKEMVIRKATKKDKKFLAKLQKAYNYEAPTKLIDIDCNLKAEILEEIYSLDQSTRTSDKDDDYNPEIDKQNLIKVVSLIEKCGMPTTKEISVKQISAIWLVFQHADQESRKKYFSTLKKSAKNGDLSKSQIAVMEDRILMMDNKPQIYGSQIIQNSETKEWKIYEIKNPKNVDKRRAKVGLEPLAVYLKKYNILFNNKQKK
jgi:hypothetical protein